MPPTTTFEKETLEIQRQPVQEDIQDMLGNPPGWLLRSGMTIAFMVLLLLLLLSWLIRYPDKMEAPVLIQSEQPPTEIIASGLERIASLLATDGAIVTEGQLLAIFENPAVWQDVQAAEVLCQNLMPLLHSSELIELEVSAYLALGDLQNTYSSLLQNLHALQYFLRQGAVHQEVAALEREVKRIQQLNSSLEKEEQLFQEEIALQQKDLDRNRHLNSDELVSDADLENKEGQWLQQQRQLEKMQSAYLQNQIRKEQLLASQQQLQREHYNECTRLKLALQQQIERLQGEIAQWKQRYLVRAPRTGRLAFAPHLNDKQYVQPGELLFTILPQQQSGRIIAHCYLPVSGIGKIQQGAAMQIYLDAYPYKEYGILATQVTEIAILPQQSEEGIFLYHTTALLPDTLTTTYQKNIPFQQKLSGKAVILTEDRRLLERVFEQLMDLFKNN